MKPVCDPTFVVPHAARRYVRSAWNPPKSAWISGKVTQISREVTRIHPPLGVIVNSREWCGKLTYTNPRATFHPIGRSYGFKFGLGRIIYPPL